VVDDIGDLLIGQLIGERWHLRFIFLAVDHLSAKCSTAPMCAVGLAALTIGSLLCQSGLLASRSGTTRHSARCSSSGI
jgi:hypothetical protein